MYKYVILALAFCAVNAKVYSPCELYADINAFGMPGDHPTWVCIALHESSYDSSVEGPVNAYDGSNDFGIFQINDHYWCWDPTYPSGSNGCNINCNPYFLDDDITDDMTCASQIYNESGGFSAWSTWQYCQDESYNQGLVAGC